MRINEIFYSLQGEGHFTGTPAIFIRFAGCNLRCSFCDTDFISYTEMSAEDILGAIAQYPSRHIVLTGGEPTLQLTSSFTTLLHAHGYFIQIETNGTNPLPEGCNIDWVTCSPKHADVRLARIDELKVVYELGKNMDTFAATEAKEYRLQPCDVQDTAANQQILESAIDYILKHPKWKLSLQTHKIINVR